jgi:2OG-Fe(II) oxygenase superfamily
MGKAGKSRKRARKETEVGSAGSGNVILLNDGILLASTTGTSMEEEEVGLDEVDIEITETTLRQLIENPTTLLRAPEARTIRSQVYAIVEALGAGKSTTGRVSDALHDGRWTDAVVLLRQLPESSSSLPLGALQRWIRDLFESTISNTDPIITCQILYLILTCTGQVPWGSDDGGTNGPMKVFPMWNSIPRRIPPARENNTIEEQDTWIVPEVQAVSVESAWREGLTLWSCYSNILDDDTSITPTRCNVPFVSGAFVMNHALSAKECRRIRQVADKMGFNPEASYSLSGTHASQAADGVVWVVHDELCQALFHRVSSLLPSELCNGKLVNLNCRWRIYRYTAGTVYRPHIDGAWTGSGIADGLYVNDIYHGKVTSRLTFLIYLNDNFEQGGTTFYAPANEAGCVVARSVAPIQGSILCFPHGQGVDNVGLVHEGSAVTKGTKYVMRSDVLYEKT